MPPLSQRMLSSGTWQQLAAAAGKYFTWSSPTPGTGLPTIATLTALADTSPFIQINAGAVPCWVDYLRLRCTAPGTGGTAVSYAVQHYATPKLAPNGVAGPLTGNNVRSDWLTATPGTSIYAGALIAAAGTPFGPITSHLVRPVIPVVGDVYTFRFGQREFGIEEAFVITGTAIANVAIPAPQFIVGPNTTSQIHIWLPSQSAASSWEVEIGGAEISD